MAAKLLHSLADENPDLQNQIGCMTGIFQLFDRHHAVTGRRINHKRLRAPPPPPPPPGTLHFSNTSQEQSDIAIQQTGVEIKSVNEKQRLSTESSRASFSSSCSSSLSVDFNNTAQQEASSSDNNFFLETPWRDPVMNLSSTSPLLGRQSLDIRGVVKDSMYREVRGLSSKAASKDNTAAHVDFDESLRVLAKLREAPSDYNETREHGRRSSYEGKDGYWHSTTKDPRRFSYDGREINRLSFETQDLFKSTPRIKELPRLSLDSRDGPMRCSNSGLKPPYSSEGIQSSNNLIENASKLLLSSGSQKRPPSVVAKLMGLEALPDSPLASDGQLGFNQICQVKNDDAFPKFLKTNNPSRPIQISNPARNLSKEPTSPRLRNPNLVMKPISSSKFPIEAAPWKMQDGKRESQKQNSQAIKGPKRTPNSCPSVYSEMEKRLKDLEFKQSGKDLRALKQILEAIQIKGFLEAKKERQASNFESQNDYDLNCMSPNLNLPGSHGKLKINHVTAASTVRGSDLSRSYESPIVIMKPAKLVEKSGISASSIIPIDQLSNLRRPRNGGRVDGKRGSNNRGTVKDHSPRHSIRDSTSSSVERKTSHMNTRSRHSNLRSQPLPNENVAINSAKSSGSVSPRLQQKKLEMEKRSRPPTPTSDPNKPRRKSHRQPTELGSPGGKSRQKTLHIPQGDDQLSEISNETRALSGQEDEIYVQSDTYILPDSKADNDIEASSVLQSTEMNGSHSPSTEAANSLVSSNMQKKSTSKPDEEVSSAELSIVASEHPSPVSVLDNTAYRDDEPSPVKQIPNVITDDNAQDCNDSQSEERWIPADEPIISGTGSGLTSVINHQKLQNVENLVQKLRQLNANCDESSTDYIASLCENTNPDHRYTCEILLASGLLLRDLGSGFSTFQLHPSGHPINPELFFVLEQTKASSLQPKDECSPEKVFPEKCEGEKFQRKLIFDAVNEILASKLSLICVSPESWLLPCKLAKKSLNSQKLLKELCFEIDQFQAKGFYSFEGEEDGLKSILQEDVIHRSGTWTDFKGEISGAVLDVERSVFKDLIDEIVMGEVANLRARQSRRRKLFAK